MKIYAIRDRLIDYFQQPFAAPGDKEVMTAIAQAINGDNEHAIKQAPHHFEIWRIGEVDDEGHITARKELIADCASLVRRSVRGSETAESGGSSLDGAESRIQAAVRRAAGAADAPQRAPEGPTQAKVSPRAEIAPGSGRLD